MTTWIIDADGTDHFEFVEMVNRIVTALDSSWQPADTYMIRIKNWFDHKWLDYSGQIASERSCKPVPVTSLKQRPQKNKSFPPFNPNRVITETLFSVDSANPGKRIHQWQKSSRNSASPVTQHSGDALFVWYSTNTQANKQGSLMVCSVKGTDVSSWYASYIFDEEWKIKQVKGFGRETLQDLMK